MSEKNQICVSRWAIRGALLMLAIGVVVALAGEAPDIRRYIQMEGM